jgi:hypothetical protein
MLAANLPQVIWIVKWPEEDFSGLRYSCEALAELSPRPKPAEVVRDRDDFVVWEDERDVPVAAAIAGADEPVKTVQALHGDAHGAAKITGRRWKINGAEKDFSGMLLTPAAGGDSVTTHDE